MKRLILSLTLLLFIPTSVSSQEDSCRRRVFAVSVVGRDEVPIAGMTAENFRGSLQGAPVKILSSEWNTNPRRIVVLLDLSTAMKGQRQWGSSNKNKIIEFLARDAVQFTRRSDKVSLVTFANIVTQRTSLTVDRKLANAWFEHMAREDLRLFQGLSALFEALGTAIDILSPYQLGDAIYLITDIGNGIRQEHVDEIEKRLLSNGIRLFAFFLQERSTFGSGEYSRNIFPVEELLGPTGGASWIASPIPVAPRGSIYDLSPTGQKELRLVANSLYQQIERFYLMEIELPRAVDKPRTWKLELSPGGGRRVKGLGLYYPTKLLPCSVTTTRKADQP